MCHLLAVLFAFEGMVAVAIVLVSTLACRWVEFVVDWYSVIQFGSLCCELLRLIPTSGYDVWGERMLGRRWRCSGADVPMAVYI